MIAIAQASSSEDDWEFVSTAGGVDDVGGGKQVFNAAAEDGFTSLTSLPARERTERQDTRSVINYLRLHISAFFQVRLLFLRGRQSGGSLLDVSEQVTIAAEQEDNDVYKLNLLVGSVALCKYAIDAIISQFADLSARAFPRRQLMAFNARLPSVESAQDGADAWVENFIDSVPAAVDALDNALDLSRDRSFNPPSHYVLIISGLKDLLHRIASSFRVVLASRSAS